MRLWPRAALAGSLGFAVSCLAACGGGAGLLSGDQANSLSNRLNQVSSAVSAHDCNGASSAAQSLDRVVSSLPSTVSATLRADLTQGASTVGQLALKDCQPTTSTPTTTITTHTNTTPTTTTTHTTTTPTTTTQTSTTTTTPATTTTTTGTTTTGPTGGGGLGGVGTIGTVGTGPSAGGASGGGGGDQSAGATGNSNNG